MNENPYPFDSSFYSPTPQNNNKENGFAVAALVLGIVSLVFTFLSCCGFFFISPILSIVAIIMAFVSKRNTEKMNGMAIAGLVMAIISIAIVAIIVMLILLSVFTPFFWLF